jgi:hypothetical protein
MEKRKVFSGLKVFPMGKKINLRHLILLVV